MGQQTRREICYVCTAALDAQFKVTLQNIRYISELEPHMGVVWIAFKKKRKNQNCVVQTIFKRSDTYRQLQSEHNLG